MANNFTLTLDTTAPSNPLITIAGGADYASAQLATCTISTGDGSPVGYQMKLWGDVDTSYDSDVQNTEVTSNWITYQTSKQVKLTSGDGNKTIYLKIRDEVWNISGQTSDSVLLDTSIPVVTTGSPDVSKISKQTGKNICSFSFQSDSVFTEYKVKVVGSVGAAQDAGVQIGTANGSINMSGTAGNYASNTPINCQINGADLETVSAGDGSKIIKVFVKDQSGLWSV